MLKKTVALRERPLLPVMHALHINNRNWIVRELLTAECHTTAPAEDSASVSTASASRDEMDFFAFETEPEDSYLAEREVMDYFRSGGYEAETLNQFSNIKSIYMN